MNKKQNYNQYKKGNKRKPNNRRITRDDQMDDRKYDKSDVEHKFNDVEWYSKNEYMLRDAASFSYNSPIGTRIPYQQMFKAGVGTESQPVSLNLDPIYDAVPGLMSLLFVPTIGYSVDSSSPANLAAQNIYSYVRYMNSGAKNYDQADLMLYFLAMDSIYMTWNWAKRIYGYARIYSTKNKYLPKIFAAADSVDLDDIVSNLADFRLQLNSFAAQISSFCVPAVMPLFIRHSWMVSNIYKDSDVDKAQLYMFNPRNYYVFSETASETGGSLNWNAFPTHDATTTVWKMKDIMAALKRQIDQVAYSEDIGVMSGDVLKAYGSEKLFKISPIDPDYEIVPVYNEEVLNQIHNSTVIGLPEMNSLNITQDPDEGFLIYNPNFQADILPVKKMVNMPWNDVTPANTMVGTRLTALFREDLVDNKAYAVIGTEYLIDRRIWFYNEDGSWGFDYVHDNIVYKDGGDTQALRVIGLLTQFDWHPLVYVFKQGTGKNYALWTVLGDISNYTLIDTYSMEQTHTTAILSEFNVPQIGSF